MKSYLRTLFIIVAVGVAYWLWQCESARNQFEDHIVKLLRTCDAGRHREAYDRAAASLRKWTSFKTFRLYLQARTERLGAFERLGKTRSGSWDELQGRDRGYVAVDLIFEKAIRTGEFSFVLENDAWRVLWFKIPMELDGPAAEIPPRDMLRESIRRREERGK